MVFEDMDKSCKLFHRINTLTDWQRLKQQNTPIPHAVIFLEESSVFNPTLLKFNIHIYSKMANGTLNAARKGGLVSTKRSFRTHNYILPGP